MTAKPNTESHTSENTATDPSTLEKSIQYILRFFDIETDLTSILNETSKADAPFSLEDAPAVLQKFNLGLEYRTGSLTTLQHLNTPSLIQMNGGQMRVLLPAKTHEGKIYNPHTNTYDESIDDIALDYSGHAILIQPVKGIKALQSRLLKQRHLSDWFWKPVTAYKPLMIEIMVCTFFINVFALALPLYSMNVYDRVIPNFATDTLVILTIGILMALIFDFVFKSIRTLILGRINAKISPQFDSELMEQLYSVPVNQMNLSVGERANLFKELQSLSDFYTTRLAPALVDFPFVALFLLAIYFISPPLAVIPLIACFVIFVVQWVIQRSVLEIAGQHHKATQAKYAQLIENLAGTATTKLYSAIGSRLFKWMQVSKDQAETGRISQLYYGISQNFSTFIVQLVTVLVVFWGVYEINTSNLTMGGLIACSILASRAIAPVMNLAGTTTHLKHTFGMLKAIDIIFNMPPENDPAQSYAAKDTVKGRIELRDVTFTYPDQQRPVLNDINLTIKPGERVGIIGRTGAGKSTLAQLIYGFLTPTAGSVLIDEHPLGAFHTGQLRRTVGVVPQHLFFFSGTLKENALLGNRLVDDATFEQAAQRAGLTQFVQQLGQGYETEVGENGTKLSGGMQQAIGLTRAFLLDPKIMLLDEPSNGMDQTLENHIIQTLGEYAKDRTFILITHRSSLLPLVDRLILLDNGKIVADGPRDKIMKKLAGKA